MAKFKLNRIKLRDAVIEIVRACEPHDLGAVKLHKVLYFSDMLTYLDTGKPITGADYRKRPFGPTCDPVLGVVSDLTKAGLLSVNYVEYHGYSKKEFALTKVPNHTSLSDSERATLHEMVDFVCRNNSAKTISDFSHDILWEMVDFGQHIPYHLALYWIPSEDHEDAIEWASSVYGEVENTRPVRATEVASGSSGALRARMDQSTGLRSLHS